MIRLNVIHLEHGPEHPPHRQLRYDTLMKELASQNITDYKIWPGIEDKFPCTGICRAFKQIVQDAKDNEQEMVCIGEDDLRFSHSESWKYFLKHIPPYFDMYLASYYSGTTTFDNRIENFRGMSLIIVARKFFDKFLSLREDINIDNALDGLGEYFVSPLFCCTQHPGFSDKDQRMVNYDDRIPDYKLFKGYEI